jgi:hypothetical protein
MEGQFSVIRYVADAARNEPVNVGVILQLGEDVEVKTHREAIRRAITSDPQADESALSPSRIEAFVSQFIHQPQFAVDDVTGIIRDIQPLDEDYLMALSAQNTGKLVFAEPQTIEVPSASKQEIERTINMLVSRLARPLRARSYFASVETPPRRAMRQAFRRWINSGLVKVDHELPSRTGVPRTADFYFENGRSYLVKNVTLEYSRESQLLARAQSEAFEIEDVRKGNPNRQWAPIVVCQFASDRAENLVWTVKKIFEVSGCACLRR